METVNKTFSVEAFECPVCGLRLYGTKEIAAGELPDEFSTEEVRVLAEYWAQSRPDGSLYGEGQGLVMGKDGEMASWKGQGVGKMLPGGAVSYRGMLYYRTASKKLERLNNMCGAFEYEVDAAGNTTSKVWEWK